MVFIPTHKHVLDIIIVEVVTTTFFLGLNYVVMRAFNGFLDDVMDFTPIFINVFQGPNAFEKVFDLVHFVLMMRHDFSEERLITESLLKLFESC
jgi:hypothetical protein